MFRWVKMYVNKEVLVMWYVLLILLFPILVLIDCGGQGVHSGGMNVYQREGRATSPEACGDP